MSHPPNVLDKDPANRGYRQRSAAESAVVHQVWAEIGGELVEEFVVPTVPGDRSRAREVDGVMASGSRQWHRARTPLDLRDRDVVVCQAKAGKLNLGVLGQTLFCAELIDRQHGPRRLRLIAAATRPDTRVQRLLSDYRPNGRTIEVRTYPDLPGGRSSTAGAPADLREVLIRTLHRKEGGLLIEPGRQRSTHDLLNVTAAGQSLRAVDPDAIILPERDDGAVSARTALEVDRDERILLVYTSLHLYMTAMGRAVFGRELARRELGLRNVRSFLRFRIDNPVLRELLASFPDVVLSSRGG